MHRKLSITILISLTAIICSCQKVTIDFKYEPSSPKAGEKVEFTNLSTGGEEYIWNFGDNQTATASSPSHIYKQAGTYLVTLQETKKGKLCVKSITVENADPYIYASQDSIYMFQPITLYIKTWNPYDHYIGFEWFTSDGMSIISKDFDKDSITVIFSKEGEVSVEADVMTDDNIFSLSKTFTIINTPAPALLMQTTEDKQYYQRLYGNFAENVHELSYERGKNILDTTTQQLKAVDSMERKIYTASSNGLTVSNENGEQSVKITDMYIRTIAISIPLNRIFYATNSGVYSLPLVHTYNNTTDDKPVKINHINNVKYINIDHNAF